MGGYAGRTGVFEVMPITSALRDLIADAASARDLRAQAVAEGMLQFRQAALLKVACGQTSTEEVFRVIPSEHLLLQDELRVSNDHADAGRPVRTAEPAAPESASTIEDEPAPTATSRKRKLTNGDAILAPKARRSTAATTNRTSARASSRPTARSNGKQNHKTT